MKRNRFESRHTVLSSDSENIDLTLSTAYLRGASRRPNYVRMCERSYCYCYKIWLRILAYQEGVRAVKYMGNGSRAITVL